MHFIGILNFSDFWSSLLKLSKFHNYIKSQNFLCSCTFFYVCLWHCLLCIVLRQVASDESDFEVDDKPHDESVVTLKMVRDLEDKIRNSR